MNNINIKPLIISVITVITVYVLMIAFVPCYYRSVDNEQTYKLKCEDYVHSSGYDVVCAGSSEMFRVNVGDIDPSWYNLALVGQNPLAGVKLILRADPKPRVVLVEINETLMRAAGDEIIERSLNAGFFERIRYRPDFLCFSLYRMVFDKFLSGLEGRSVNETMIEGAIEKYAKPCDAVKLNEALTTTREYVDTMKEQGIKVYLVEMPIDHRLYDTVMARDIREKANAVFPPDEYDWITCDWSEYSTQDGIHLTYDSADRYAGWLVDYVKKDDGMSE